MFCVSCHLSPVTNTNSQIPRPPPVNFPAMHSWLACLKPKLKNSKRVSLFFNFSDLLLDQKSPVNAMARAQLTTNIRTSQIIEQIGLEADSVKSTQRARQTLLQ